MGKHNKDYQRGHSFNPTPVLTSKKPGFSIKPYSHMLNILQM